MLNNKRRKKTINYEQKINLIFPINSFETSELTAYIKWYKINTKKIKHIPK